MLDSTAYIRPNAPLPPHAYAFSTPIPGYVGVLLRVHEELQLVVKRHNRNITLPFRVQKHPDGCYRCVSVIVDSAKLIIESKLIIEFRQPDDGATTIAVLGTSNNRVAKTLDSIVDATGVTPLPMLDEWWQLSFSKN